MCDRVVGRPFRHGLRALPVGLRVHAWGLSRPRGSECVVTGCFRELLERAERCVCACACACVYVTVSAAPLFCALKKSKLLSFSRENPCGRERNGFALV